MLRNLLITWMLLITLAACAPDTSTEAPTVPDLTVTSAAFEEGGVIPMRHGCDGENVSPPLTWAGAPEGTAAFALIVDDPDADGFVHWLLADLDPGTDALAEGATGGTAGRNGFGQSAYGGPCPPSGAHRYTLTVFALSETLGLSVGYSADELRDAMEGKVLSSGSLTASYDRG